MERSSSNRERTSVALRGLAFSLAIPRAFNRVPHHAQERGCNQKWESLCTIATCQKKPRHTRIEKPFLIGLRFASTPTRATPARVGDPGAARRPAAQGRLFAFAPAGAGSSPV